MECVKNDTIEGAAEPVDGTCTEIIVVRHGETEWNALRKMQVCLLVLFICVCGQKKTK